MAPASTKYFKHRSSMPLASPHGHGSSLNKVFQAQVVDASSGQDHVGPGGQDLVDPLLGDVTLPVPHLLKLGGVVHQQLHAHLHLHLLQGEVKTGNLGLVDSSRHLLRGDGAVQGVAIDKHALPCGLSMSLQHVDGLDGVVVADLDGLGCVYNHLGKELIVGAIDQTLLAKIIDLKSKMLLDVLDSLLAGQPVPGDDRSWVDLLLHQLVRVLQQLGCNDDHTGGAVADLLVLQGGQLNKHLGSRVLHLKQLEDGGAVVGDGDVAHVVHHHLVQANWTEAALHNVCNG